MGIKNIDNNFKKLIIEQDFIVINIFKNNNCIYLKNPYKHSFGFVLIKLFLLKIKCNHNGIIPFNYTLRLNSP